MGVGATTEKHIVVFAFLLGNIELRKKIRCYFLLMYTWLLSESPRNYFLHLIYGTLFRISPIDSCPS